MIWALAYNFQYETLLTIPNRPGVVQIEIFAPAKKRKNIYL